MQFNNRVALIATKRDRVNQLLTDLRTVPYTGAAMQAVVDEIQKVLTLLSYFLPAFCCISS